MPLMKLRDYLDTVRMSDDAFGQRIGVTRQAVGRYKRGERTPEWDVFERIVVETQGRVTPNDWLSDGVVERFRGTIATAVLAA